MYIYRVSDEDTNKVKGLTQSQDLDVLKNKIDNLNKSFESYTPSVPESTKFEKLEQVSATDDELMDKATKSLDKYKNDSIKSINDKAFNEQSALVDSVDTIKDNASAEKENVASNYANAREIVGADALRRGLARSSIVINNIDALTREELDRYNAIDADVTKKIDAINFQMSAIEAQRANALSDFDIEYAVKLDQKLSGLKEDLAKQQMEITKYNNDIAKLENDYNIKYANLQADLDKEAWDREYDLTQLAGKYGVNLLDKYKNSRVYSLVKEYLNNFTHDEALKILQNSDYLKNVLGARYNAMVSEI